MRLPQAMVHLKYRPVCFVRDRKGGDTEVKTEAETRETKEPRNAGVANSPGGQERSLGWILCLQEEPTNTMISDF